METTTTTIPSELATALLSQPRTTPDSLSFSLSLSLSLSLAPFLTVMQSHGVPSEPTTISVKPSHPKDRYRYWPWTWSTLLAFPLPSPLLLIFFHFSTSCLFFLSYSCIPSHTYCCLFRNISLVLLNRSFFYGKKVIRNFRVRMFTVVWNVEKLLERTCEPVHVCMCMWIILVTIKPVMILWDVFTLFVCVVTLALAIFEILS